MSAHPGCFATATLLAIVPLLALGLTDTRLFVTGITGSTGSGRKPVDGTHHPHRHSDLYTYGALSHRHVPEIVACAKLATGVEAELNFVPHSAPFARGIHVTVQASLKKTIDTAQALEALKSYYQNCPFVRVGDIAPRGQGRGGQQLLALGRGDQRQFDRRHGGARQSEQGRRRRRHSMDESLIGSGRDDGAHRPRARLDLRRAAAAMLARRTGIAAN